MITYSDMPGELRDKLKLQKTLNKILKNNDVVDIEALEGVVNELKTELNTLINDVLGVEHSIDEIYDTNVKENLQEVTDQVNNVHTDINNITAKLINMTSATTKLSLTNSNQVEISSLLHDGQNESRAIIQLQYILLVNKDAANTFYEGLNLGGASNEAGSGIMTSNKVVITHQNLLRKVEVTANQTNISDVNGLVFSQTSIGVRISDFSNTNHVGLINFNNIF
jgi:seryl-tRNA synthetase